MKLKSKALIGTVAGDIMGQPYESMPYYLLGDDIELFNPDAHITDDTILTLAIAEALMTDMDFKEKILKYARRFPKAGYGTMFKKWMKSRNHKPYNSYGNGAAMRVAPVAWVADTLEEVLDLAKRSSEVTHNHPEGIKGAQAVASAIFLARNGASKKEIKQFIEKNFDYKLDFTIESIKYFYSGNAVSQVSIPPSIVAFLDSNDFLSAIYNAIIIGGDTDTQAVISGSIACAFYKDIPPKVYEYVEPKLPSDFIDLINEFENRYVFRE